MTMLIEVLKSVFRVSDTMLKFLVHTRWYRGAVLACLAVVVSLTNQKRQMIIMQIRLVKRPLSAGKRVHEITVGAKPTFK